ncbi:hypothetical protein APZ00_13200 [Pannonibacter phragmitetus]|uniref:Uncharacterized protein n=1 Tax=Pannonibacter phragmitetus TaxID=121719 RepID=A0A0U3FP09_9HYPH|nr:hypothetical protein APZ00_13200 [Pannonibacter phragmitetus]
MTFGNLVKNVIEIDEFLPMKERLTDAKKHRDYFAHHFFREEDAIYMNDVGCWHLLYQFKKVKDMLTLLDRDLWEPFAAMCKRLSLPIPTNEHLDVEAVKLVKEAELQLSSGEINLDWTNK